MDYRIYGPIEIPRQKNGLIARDKDTQREFWDEVDDLKEHLSDACGIYCFILRNKIWYVGCAEKQAFYQECFTSHKIVQYDDAISTIMGAPYLLLIARVTKKGRLCKPSKGKNGHKDISLLENMLIGTGLQRNELLLNVKGTKIIKEIHVPGYLNTKKGYAKKESVKAFKRAFGL